MTVFFVTAEQAHVEHNTDAPVVVITPFAEGFHPIYTRETIDQLNDTKCSPEILAAAVVGVRFGWHVPGAKPALDFVEQSQRDEEAEKNAQAAEDATYAERNIAKTFASMVRQTVTADQWSAIRERNRHYPPGKCASYEFCDAHGLMLKAMNHEGFVCNPMRDQAAWSAIWNRASARAKTEWLTRPRRR